MTARRAKLDRVYAALTAPERAVLLLRALLAGEHPDPQVRATTPPGQLVALNRLIVLANGILHVLLPTALQIRLETESLQLRSALLQVLLAWGSERAGQASDAALLAHIPLAESVYRERLAQLRQEFLPLRDAAAVVAERRGISGTQALKQVRAAVAEIPSRRRGRAVEIERGGLADWLGEEVQCLPDWGASYEIVADAAFAARAERLGAAARLRALEAPAPWEGPMQTLSADVQSDLLELGGRLTALEQVVAEVRAEFEDDDVIPAAVRGCLVEAHRTLETVAQRAPSIARTPALPPPDEAFLTLLRRAVRREETYE